MSLKTDILDVIGGHMNRLSEMEISDTIAALDNRNVD